MKNLLNYQTTEYDCGPVSLLNGLRYLYEREEICPEIIKHITLYCMDAYDEEGSPCKNGTSPDLMRFLGSWLNHFGKCKNFPIHCEFLTGREVSITPESRLLSALQKGGAIVLHVYLEVPHYVLLTGTDHDRVLLFDPFYEEIDDPNLDKEYDTEEIAFLLDSPKSANRSVSMERLNRTGTDYYEMGETNVRMALLMFNTRTTPDWQ